MDDKLKNYIHEDDSEKKENLSEQLLNESTDEFLDECRMNNLLSSAFDEIDVADQTLETLSDKNADITYLAEDVLETIRNKKQKNHLTFILSGIAAILALSFILMNLNTGSEEQISQKNTNSKILQNNSKKYKEIIQLPEGVVLKIIEDSDYKLIEGKGEFLSLAKGHILVEVESREGKSPLFFKMPDSTVKVTGTSFTLRCDSESSFVAVHEGSVQLIKKGRTVKLSANQFDSTVKDFINSGEILNGLVDSFSFESLEGLKYEGNPKVTQGVKGGALNFDGSTKVIIPRSTKVNEESISFWFRVSEFYGEPQSIIGQNQISNSSNGFNIIINKKGALVLQIKDRLNMNKGNKAPIEKDKWHHVAFCRSENGDIAFYLDGKLVHSENFKYSYRNENIYLGKSLASYWEYFKGTVDELKIYNRSLSHKEVLRIYGRE